MEILNLQAKTKAKKGKAEKYWFENEHIGLKRTLFHRVSIPLTPFNSGLDYESQPLETEIVIDWLDLNLNDHDDLDGLVLTSTPDDETEASIYLGAAHNPCDIIKMKWKRAGDHRYIVSCELLVDFEYEGVGKNERFSFETEIALDPTTKE